MSTQLPTPAVYILTYRPSCAIARAHQRIDLTAAEGVRGAVLGAARARDGADGGAERRGSEP